MMKFLRTVAFIASFIFFTPALASNELVGKNIAQIQETITEKHMKVMIMKLSPAEIKNLETWIGPQPMPGTLVVLVDEGSVVLTIVDEEGNILFSSDPAPVDVAKKFIEGGRLLRSLGPQIRKPLMRINGHHRP